MGKLVVFWSPQDNSFLVSLCMTAMIAAMRKKIQGEIAVAQVQKNEQGTQNMLCKEWRSAATYADKKSGMAALFLNFKQAKLTEERIRRCGIPLRKENVHLFYGMSFDAEQMIQEETERIVHFLITKELTKAYEWVFAELPQGRTKLAEQLRRSADLVVTVLPQNPVAWAAYFAEERIRPKEQQEVYLIGDYLSDSRFNRSYLSFRYRVERAAVEVIPLNTGFRDAALLGKGLDFYLQHSFVKAREENYKFMKQTNKAAELIYSMPRKRIQEGAEKEEYACGV